MLDACCWRKILVPWVPSFAFAHISVNELPRHQSKPRVSCRGLRTWIFWRVAFNSIVAFHRGIIHLLPKSKKEYLLCQCQRATTLFRSKFYFVLHLIIEPLFVLINHPADLEDQHNHNNHHEATTLSICRFGLACRCARCCVGCECTHHLVMNIQIYFYLHHCILY